jgi:predicted nucleic acid-binding protein
VIVIDTTAVVNGLMPDGASRERLASDELHVPHLTGSEVVSTLTRLVRNGRIEAEAAKRALDRWAMLGAQRHAVRDLMPRMWALRDDVKA